MRVGPETELRSTEVLKTWRKVRAAKDHKFGGFTLCKYCDKGSGQKRDRLTGKTTTCSFCKGWGMVRDGSNEPANIS